MTSVQAKQDRFFDVAIIGGGIVGCATGMVLSRISGLKVVLLEAENTLAAHQTGNNSGVIHSGLYYKPGSLKARNCAAGREALYVFCAQHNIPHERCGKIVVATAPAEIPALDELARRGQANGLDGIRRLGPLEISNLEPRITGIAGLFVPQTGIVDYTAVTHKYAQLMVDNGSTLVLGARLTRVVHGDDHLQLQTTAGSFPARHLINCAGLHSDRVARLCGHDPGLKIVPFRGEYYEFTSDHRNAVNNLVYPVPDPRFPFLGVHFTRMVRGGVEAGPNAVLALKREGYGRFSFSARDVLSYLFYRGFWRMASLYWRTGLGEMWRSWSKGAFIKALRKLMPDLAPREVRRGGTGVRAQALLPDGKLADDFQIVETDQMIHVLNAPSPAATASLAIADHIAAIARRRFNL